MISDTSHVNSIINRSSRFSGVGLTLSGLISYIVHHTVRKYHAIIDNSANDGVSVSQDAVNNTGIIIDTIGTIYASAAA